MHRAIAIILLGLMAASCGSNAARRSARAAQPPDWVDWRAKRRESIAGPNGWTTLILRHWLDEGRNFVGSDPTNHAVLPRERAPANIGAFVRSGRAVRFEAAPGIVAMIDGKPGQSADLQSDTNGAPTKLLVGALSFVIIDRGERIGLRARDPEAPARVHFPGLDCFAYDPAWNIAGRFEPFVEPQALRVPD